MSLCNICTKKKTLIDRIRKSHNAKTAVKIFIDFCEKQLKDNLNIQYIVRTKEIYNMGEESFAKLSDFGVDTSFEDLFYSDEKIIEQELEKLMPLK